MNRALLIEDERGLAITIRDRFVASGFRMDVEPDGERGLRRAVLAEHDLVVLDVMLPGCTGLEIVRQMRERRVQTPVLMLTARGDVADRIAGLKLGADDYLPKPFDMGELMARAEALLRRGPGGACRVVSEASFPDFRIDFRTGLLCKPCGESHVLPAREAHLLRTLVGSPGRVWSREELLSNIWQLAPDTWTRTGDVHVASLRRKLEPEPKWPRYILTVAKVGYQFNASWR